MTIDIKFDISKAKKTFTQEVNNSLVFDGNVQFAGIQSTVVGDFNGDQIQDLFSSQSVLLGTIDSPVFIQLGDGQGNFSDGTSLMFGSNIPTTHVASQIFSFDFNGDGKTDIFIPDFGPDVTPFPGGQNSLFLTTADGMTDASGNLPQVLDLSHGASVGDIDLDGDLDIVVNNLNITNKRVHILINDGSGNFSEGQERIPQRYSENIINIPEGTLDRGHTKSLLHDVNSDGAIDLILGSPGGLPSQPSEIYLNDGQGDFSRSTGIELPGVEPTDIVVDIDAIDLNSDTLPDLVLSITSNNYQKAYLQFLINDGNGQFHDETEIRLSNQADQIGYWITRVSIVDLNGDGATDFITEPNGQLANRKAKIYQNDGTGQFSERYLLDDLPFGRGDVFAQNAIDFNGDGLLDIAVTVPDSDANRIFPQSNATIVLLNETPAIPETVENGVYRFFNTQTGTHFYSASEIERDSIINNLDNFNFESAAFKAATETNGPTASVFRFFNTETGTHFFTQSTVERDSVIENLPSFNLEGEAYLGYTEEVADSTPLYRFFNTDTGTHFYTAAEAEKDSIVANLPSFNFEGTAYWVDPVMG